MNITDLEEREGGRERRGGREGERETERRERDRRKIRIYMYMYMYKLSQKVFTCNYCHLKKQTLRSIMYMYSL